MEKLSKVGAELYADVAAAAQAAGATEAPGADAPPPAGGSAKKAEKKADVVDADFEVVDEDKNKK
jgi:molecular chaperone DnaK